VSYLPRYGKANQILAQLDAALRPEKKVNLRLPAKGSVQRLDKRCHVPSERFQALAACHGCPAGSEHDLPIYGFGRPQEAF
jgi:hypothetical protein